MALAVPPGMDPLVMTVQPMTVRTDYLLSTKGHRMTGTLKGQQVIDTDWQSSAAKAAQVYGRLLGKLAAQQATRYTTPDR